MLALMLAAQAVNAGQVWLPAAGGLQVPAQSMAERRFARIVPQQYDYSCGSAAVATLLTYQYGDPVPEQQVFQAMWTDGDQAKIRREGFSLLDIKRYLGERGYQANGYIVPLDKLKEVDIPAIALISDRGYNHFVVIKGLGHDRVMVGDPARGGYLVPREDFERMLLSPILFVITDHQKQAVFNGQRDWRLNPTAPLGAAVSTARLNDVTRMRSGAGDF